MRLFIASLFNEKLDIATAPERDVVMGNSRGRSRGEKLKWTRQKEEAASWESTLRFRFLRLGMRMELPSALILKRAVATFQVASYGICRVPCSRRCRFPHPMHAASLSW